MLFLNYTPELTETDMTIYREIVKDMDAVVYMRIRDLAEATYCSTASIQRFCQKFDCSGWAEFKTKLRMYNAQRNHRGQLPNDIDGGEITRSIAACEDGQYQQAMDRAAHLLYEHAQVVWIGFGTSKLIADYGAVTYSNSVNMAFAITEPSAHPQIDYPEAVYNAMCVVICSVSGENRVAIGYMNELMKHGVPIIAITNSSNSTIARLATVALAYYVTTQDLDGANLTSQTPAIYIIEKITRRAMMLARPDNVRQLEDNLN